MLLPFACFADRVGGAKVVCCVVFMVVLCSVSSVCVEFRKQFVAIVTKVV